MNLFSKIKFIDDEFGKGILWNIAALSIFGLSGILINVIISIFSGSSALGFFNIVLAFYLISSQISVGGIHYSVLKQISYNPNDLKLCASSSTNALIAVFPPSVLVALLIYLCRNSFEEYTGIADLSFGLLLIAPALIAFSFNKVLINVINAHSHMRAFAVFNTLRVVFVAIAVTTIIYLDYPDRFLAFALTFAEFTLMVILIIYNYINLVLFNFYLVSTELIYEHLHFGVRGFLSGFMVEANTRIDILALSLFVSVR